MKRVLTAGLLIPAVIAVNFYAPVLVLRSVLALVGLLCLHEYFGIAEHSRVRPFRKTGYAAGLLVILLEAFRGLEFFVILAVLLLIAAIRHPHGGLGAALQAVGATLFGVIYTAGPFALGGQVHQIDPHWLFFVLVVSWFSDSAAYYVGQRFGRHKLAPAISPNKSWEGTIASSVAGTLVGVVYWQLYLGPERLAAIPAVVLSFLANAACQVGDLAESALKRGADVKDSGQLLPGHGGMLDRVDGLLFALPVVYLYLELAG